MESTKVRVCECKLCKRSKEFQDNLAKLPEGDKGFWKDLYNNLCNVEADLDYYKCVVDGSWPNADQVIANHRINKE